LSGNAKARRAQAEKKMRGAFALAHKGHLVIVDRRKSKRWSEKIFQRTRKVQGKQILVWGM
jgi:hypothetical protein